MAGLKNRLLRVAFDLSPAPSTGQFTNPFAPNASGTNVILNETFDLRVRVTKACLALQSQAIIEVTNLPAAFRQQLMSQFSAWNQNQRLVNGVQQPYIDVYIAAGYEWVDDNGQTQNNLGQIFHGQVAMCDQVGVPPNLAVRIVCYTKQVNKTRFVVTDPPYQQSFRQFVLWAGNEMGFDNEHIICDTSQDNQIITNMFRSRSSVASLLPRIQDQYNPNVAAFIDDDFLYVKDLTKIINKDDVITLNEFIGPPNWTEWGVEGTVFVDPAIRLAVAAKFESILNPSMNGVFIVLQLQYWLASRRGPFYVTVNGSPPATD
ncbi:hypothetical protein IAG25_25415 [Caballeronia sp. EK]|uniref:baseplate hub protein n=1 Tax=Caballeronia sp. EK TaxID=2767469 RepID=UPI0016560717|nr:hypothetical protein [Caballeronia sp. EK]MBC8640174.1 hypothetical protein [Caballeronia sp. EK]